jgi:hypothetical protein
VLAALAGPAEATASELDGYDRIRQAFEAAGASVGGAAAAGTKAAEAKTAGSKAAGTMSTGSKAAGTKAAGMPGQAQADGPRSRGDLRLWGRRRGIAVRVGVLAGALLVAGVGTAAADALPTPLQKFAHTVLGAIGVPGPSDSGGQGTRSGSSPTATGSGRSDVSSPGAAPRPSSAAEVTPSAGVSPTVSDVALCQTFKQDGDGHTLTVGEETRLEQLAGGKHIAKYCKDLLAETPAGSDASGGTAATSAPTTAGNDNGNGNGKGKGKGKGKGNANGVGNS